jgi:hypothetical protein
MKRWIWIIGILPLLLVAGEQKKKSTAKPVVVRQIVVPPGAKQMDANTWRYTDAKGKTWMYSRSPFGMTRYEETAGTSAGAQTAVDTPEGMKAFPEGDKVRFETSGPFGVTRWVKGKDEMSDVERRVWERDAPEAAKPAPPASGAERKE